MFYFFFEAAAGGPDLLSATKGEPRQRQGSIALHTLDNPHEAAPKTRELRLKI
jgi:hypothetical protein